MTTRTYLSIGDVLSLLREEFPDVTISKIRFLESQGLVNPERSPSGYRKFYDHDVERLRWVLRQQREHFLPLKVIRDRLAQDDPASVGPVQAGEPTHDPFNGSAGNGLPHSEVPERARAATAATGAAPTPSALPGRADEAARMKPPPGVVTTRAPGSQMAPTVHAPAAQAPAAPPAAPGPPPPAPPAPRPAVANEGQPPRFAGARASGWPDESRSGLPPRQAAATVSVATASVASPPTAPVRAPTRAPVPEVRAPQAATQANVDVSPAGGGGAAEPEEALTGPQPAAVSPSRPPSAASLADPAPNARRDAAGTPEGAEQDRAQPPTVGGSFATAQDLTGASLTIDELAAATGLSVTDIATLEGFGLIEAISVAGASYYDEDALTIGKLVANFSRYGVEPRHLRLYRNAVEREMGLIEQVVTPLLRQRNPESRQRAVDAATDLAKLGQSLRSSLLRRALKSQFSG